MKVRRAVVALVVSIVVVGFVIVAVFPTRTYLSQKASISRAEKQLHVLGQQNAELEQRAKQLQSDAEIERLARERYNLVKPGEEAYAVLPPPQGPTTTTTAPPRPVPAQKHDDGNIVQRAWDAVTGLF